MQSVMDVSQWSASEVGLIKEFTDQKQRLALRCLSFLLFSLFSVVCEREMDQSAKQFNYTTSLSKKENITYNRRFKLSSKTLSV